MPADHWHGPPVGVRDDVRSVAVDSSCCTADGLRPADTSSRWHRSSSATFELDELIAGERLSVSDPLPSCHTSKPQGESLHQLFRRPKCICVQLAATVAPKGAMDVVSVEVPSRIWPRFELPVALGPVAVPISTGRRLGDPNEGTVGQGVAFGGSGFALPLPMQSHVLHAFPIDIRL